MGCFNDPAWKVCGLVGGGVTDFKIVSNGPVRQTLWYQGVTTVIEGPGGYNSD